MEPLRTCLACRHKAEKRELCRFVRASDGEICFDVKGELPHRGAWLCAKKLCLSKAFKKRLLFRGERTLPVEQDIMVARMTSLVKKSTLSTLGLMKRQGKIEAGRDAVRRIIFEQKAQAIIFAKDFSTRSAQDIEQRALESKGITAVLSPLLMDELGQCLGRKKTGVVALMESRITSELLSRIDKLRGLES